MASILPVLGVSPALKRLRCASAQPPAFRASNASAAPSSLGKVRCLGVSGSSPSRRSAEEPSLSPPVLGRTGNASALALATSLMSAGASLADEVAAGAVDPSDVGISNTVSTLFILATIGLTVLTSGVIYLGFTEFMEKRALQEEQKKVEEAKAKKQPAKKSAKAKVPAGGAKGFGGGRTDKGVDEETSI